MRAAAAAVIAAALAAPAGAQQPAPAAPGGMSAAASQSLSVPSVLPGAVQGGVPRGQAGPDEVALTLQDAIARGLRANLAAILGSSAVEAAGGAEREARSALLPQLSGTVSAVREKINLAAFGFSGFPGFDIPLLVGPFNVFDARVRVDQAVLDLRALHRARSASQALEAARQDEHGTRDLVVLACAGLYLQALAGEARIVAARAELDTAEALLGLARDRRASGLGAGIEVLRADVQAQAVRQRLIVATQDAAKQKLALARAIGLPIGQRFRLADTMPFAAGLPMSVDEAVARAWQLRPDLLAARARVASAEEAVSAARGEGLPSIGVSADYGAIGNTVPGALATYTLTAALRVSLFEGGRVQARTRQAEVRLQDERARLEDLRARTYYEVQSAFLDLQAAEDRVKVAEGALSLAREQLAQSRDRFAAGVADNVEVVQSQEALATAEENRIASLYAHNVARFSLARALGGVETSYESLVRGR